MKNNVLNNIYTYINNYDLLSVIAEDNNNNRKEFYISGIKVFRKDLTDIGFRCFCSDTVVPDDFVKSAEILVNGNIIIKCGAVNYTLTPIKERGIKTKCHFDEIVLDVFIDKNMIDRSNIRLNNKKVFLPVDYLKIGILSNFQETKIKMLIDNVFDGMAVKYQCCRVPAFSVEFMNDGEYIIHGHIYDIGNREYLNSVCLYSSKEDFNDIHPYKTFVEFAKEFLE